MKGLIKKVRGNKKGFTLAELLVVVAIVGVLVAISIPIFTAQLEKAREATDLANIRAAKAAAVSAYLSEEKIGNTTLGSSQTETVKLYYDANNGVLKDSADDIAAYGKGTATIGSSSNEQLDYDPGKKAKKVFSVNITKKGAVTVQANAN